MGSADDFIAEGTRRMVINAAYWCLGLDDKIKADSNVGVVGDFNPTPFGFGKFIKGKRPVDYDLSQSR